MSCRHANSKLTFVCLLLLLGAVSQAIAFDLAWSLGAVDENPDEFGDDIYGTVAAPGSANARDDHYYFAGIYPSPIGNVTANEPIANFEKYLTTGTPISRIYFHLSPPKPSPPPGSAWSPT